jgi:hypothetical protein
MTRPSAPINNTALALPHFSNRRSAFISGRNPYEGYQRAWGLQFGGLRDQIRADPLYQKALAIAQDRTIVADDNRMNLFLIIRFFSQNFRLTISSNSAAGEVGMPSLWQPFYVTSIRKRES